MCARVVSLMYSSELSGEKHRPLGSTKSSTSSCGRAAPRGDPVHPLEVELLIALDPEPGHPAEGRDR